MFGVSCLVPAPGGFWQLSAIDFTDVSEHIPVGKITLPWQTEGLHETAEVHSFLFIHQSTRDSDAVFSFSRST